MSGGAFELLARVRWLGIRMWLADGRLRYSAPPGTLTPDLRAELAAHRSDLVDLLGGAGPANPIVRRESPSSPAPLSFQQRRTVLLAELAPQDSSYNVWTLARVRGPLNVTALHTAYAAVVARHEMLRCRLVASGDEPMQVITDRPAQWRRLRVADADEARRVLAEQARTPFDLYRDPLARAVLAEVAADEHFFLLTVHHSACDGMSVDILLRELGARYADAIAGRLSSLPPPAVRYVDFASWQRELWRGDVVERELDFWRRALADAPDALSLPTDRPRPPRPSFRGHNRDIAVPPDVVTGLREVSRRVQATMFMTLLAAYAVLLHRHSGQDDILIGTPIAGRRPDTQDIVGQFADTVVIRVDLSGHPTFQTLLRRVRRTALDAYAHAELPHDLLVERLVRRRDPSRHPLFQVFFSYEDRSGGLELDGTRTDLLYLPGTGATLDLTCTVADTEEGGLRLVFDAASDLFEPATTARMRDHLASILATVAADPDVPIDAIDMLGDAPVLGAGPVVNQKPATLPELIAGQAERTPDAVAIVGDGRTMTYAELVRSTDRLASALACSGAGPETVVAVEIPRSIELVVALCAVHRVGAAYLPLDEDLPAQRRAFMVADAQPVLTLTRDGLQVRTGGEVTAPWPLPENPAHVLYTSGSTGVPKAVVVPHAAVVNFLTWVRHELDVTSRDRILLKTSAAFDASVLELFLPLISGATLVIARPDGHADPAYLARLIDEQRVSIVQFVPSILQVLLSAPATIAGRSLRMVVCGGEELPEPLVRRFREQTDLPLHNLYGPTEAAVYASHWRLTAEHATPVPIGRPAWNTDLRVLDARLRPVPPGVLGELYIAGNQLARGYLGQPGLTAQRFVPDPHGPPGSRMYRTGDLARWRADGALLFAGRADDQVKIRGVRVEPGEIESVLNGHRDVDRAVVVSKPDTDGGTELVAYVVPSSPDPDLLGELRALAAARLPAQLVPAAFVPMTELPLTPNGKLNRAALPEPVRQATVARRRPSTPREELLCNLVGAILGTAPPGVDDNFFELGGHSLLALRLSLRVRQVLGVDIGMPTVFEAPTVAALAARMGSGARTDLFDPVIPMRTGVGGSPLFCVHPAAGISWCYAGLLRHLNHEQPLYVLQDARLANAGTQPSTIDAMARQHVDTIRRMGPPSQRYHLLGWSFGGLVAHAVATLLRAAGEDVGLLAIVDAYPPDGTRWPRMTKPQAMSRVLATLGYDRTDVGGFPEFIEVLRRDSSPLAGLNEKQVDALVAVLAANVQQAQEYTPGVYPGDVVLFHTPEHTGADARARWRPHVRGDIAVHEVTADHDTMMHGDALAAIASVVSQALDEPCGMV